MQLNVVTGDVGKHFYFANLTYDISSTLYAYAGYSYLDDKSIVVLKDGMATITGGVGYRANDNVIIKAQYVDFKPVKDTDPFVRLSPDNFHTKALFAGVSVYF